MTAEPSLASDGFSFTAPALTGTVSISGTAKIGVELSATPSGLPEGATPTYAWYRVSGEGESATEEQIGGAASATYKPNSAADVGKYIRVKVSAEGYSGTVDATTSAVVAKAEGSTVDTSGTLATSVSHNSIKVSSYKVSGTDISSSLQFACVTKGGSVTDETSWYDTEITGLTASTEYDLYARYKATDTQNAGASQKIGVAKTNAAPIDSVSVAVDTPTKGYDLDTTVDVSGATAYTASVAWYEGGADSTTPASGKAKGGTQYTAKITLTAKAGESFSDSGVTVTLNGTELTSKVTPTDGKLVFTKTFDPTASADALSGSVTIDKTNPQFGDTLTANTTGLIYGTETAGTLSYQWYRGDAAISGATNSTYTVAADDMNKTIKVEVKNSNNSGSVTSDPTAPVVKQVYTGSVPDAPSVTKTHNTVTVSSPVSTNEYTISETTSVSGVWKSGETVSFTELQANTTYYVFARVMGTDTTKASDASSATSVTTDKAPANDGLKNTLKNALTAYAGTYDGAEHDAFTVGTLPTGWSVQYADSESGSYSTTMPKIKNVSDSKTLWVKFSNSGYSDVVTSYTVSVAAKSISGATVTLNATEKPYSGSEQTVSVSSVTLSGGTTTLATSDYTVTGLNGTDANTYTVTVTGKGNYKDTADATWKISKATLTLSATVQEKVYDGTTTATIQAGTLTGVKGTDDVSVAETSITGTFADQYAGTDKTVTTTNSFTLTGEKTNNYTLTQPTGLKGNITAATQTITAENKTIVKNGAGVDISGWASSNAEGATLSYTLEGTPSGITLSDMTLTAANDDSTAPSFTIKVNSAAVDKNGDSNPEYSAATEQTITVTVTSKTTASLAGGVTQNGCTYGETLDDPSYTPPEGMVGTATVTYTGTLTKDSSAYNSTAKPTEAGNYTVTVKCETATHIYTATDNFTISKATLTVTAKPHSITYGDAPAGNGVEYSGFKYSDTESVVTGTPTYSYSYTQYGNVGSSYTITPSGLSAGNYSINYVSGTLTVMQKERPLWLKKTGQRISPVAALCRWFPSIVTFCCV